MKKVKVAGMAMVVGCMVAGAGCGAAVPILIGAGGTAFWQHGKIISEEIQTPAALAQATKAAFTTKKIAITNEVSKAKAIQLRGENPDLKKVSVDIIKISDQLTRLEIRVGVAGEQEPARDLLMEIKKNL